MILKTTHKKLSKGWCGFQLKFQASAFSKSGWDGFPTCRGHLLSLLYTGSMLHQVCTFVSSSQAAFSARDHSALTIYKFEQNK